MAGNSQRKGAMRKAGTKKGAVVGSGGQRKQGLEGRGPTPKAEERPAHKAYKRAQAAAKGANGSAGRPARSGRKTEGTEAVVGRNSVVEAMRAGVPVKALHIQQFLDSDDRVREVMQIALDRQIPLLETTKTDLDRLSGGAIHQGLVLQVPPYEYAEPRDILERAMEKGEDALIIALDGITDPRNLGAIVRSAAAFGAHGVIVPERRAAGMTASAWKTSAGAASRVPVARATNLTRALVDLKKAGCMVVGLAADGELSLPELTNEIGTSPMVLVVGSEGKGLSRLVTDTCDYLLSIPIAADTESLNAGIAAGVALYGISTVRRG